MKRVFHFQPLSPRNGSKGFTLLELLIALAIVVIVVGSFFQAFNTALRNWLVGEAKFKLLSQSQVPLTELNARVKSVASVNSVSLSGNDNGYFQFNDAFGNTITIFRNSAGNKASFGNNSYVESALVVVYNSDAPELVYDSIAKFNVTTYEEDATYFRIASANNTISTPNTSAIISARFAITKTDNSIDYVLVKVIKESLAAAGTLVFGDSHNGNTSFSFRTQSGYAGFTTDNMSLLPDNGNFSSEPDGAALVTQSLTVKIRHSGQYFSSIQDAIDYAVSGNEILVASRSGGYTESLTLKTGVRLFGGFDPETWERNLLDHETELSTPGGISDKAITLQSNCIVDGFAIDGGNLQHGIYGQNVSNIQISNCLIDKADKPIELRGSSGLVYNNTVTANETSLTVLSLASGSLTIMRNRFFSNNQAFRENVIIRDSKGVLFKNNIVENGYGGLLITGQVSDKADVDVFNNIFTNMDNIGIVAFNAILDLHNNAIFENRVGLFYPFPDANVAVEHNLFADHSLGHVLGAIVLDGSNIQDGTNYTWSSSNPYFEDVVTFVLKDSASTMIDGGKVGSAYEDVYTVGGGFIGPGKGGSRNDIGLRGGPDAGRNGQGQSFVVTSGGTIQTQLNAMLPGDQLRIENGSYSVSNLLPKKYVYISGEDPEQTTLTRSSGSQLMTLSEGTTIANLQLNGNSSTALLANSASRLFIKGNFIRGSSEGIYLTGSSDAYMVNNTFYQNTDGLRLANTAAAFLYENLFASNTSFAIRNQGSVGAYSSYSNFHNNGTSFSGTVIEDNTSTSVPTSPLFFDVTDNNYYLHPSADARDGSPVGIPGRDPWIDLGCFEFYISTGNFTTPTFNATQYTSYKYINYDLFGTAGAVPSTNGRHATLQSTLISNGGTYVVPYIATINQSVVSEVIVTLPVTAISNQFNVKTTITSYRFGHTPYVNRMTLSF